MGIRFGGFNCSAKGTESPGELAPSSSCMLLTPGKFKKNVSDRTEFAYHLHKNLQLLVSLDIVHLGICARVEKHFIGTEWSLAAHLYAKYYLYLKDWREKKKKKKEGKPEQIGDKRGLQK